jgi:hypothetical protein
MIRAGGSGFNPDNHPTHPFLEINPRGEAALTCRTNPNFYR